MSVITRSLAYGRGRVREVRKVKAAYIRRRMQRRAQPFLQGQGFSFITQNCIGIRFSQWAKDGYRSPTVNLWFKPGGFLDFVEQLPEYLAMEVVEDPEQSNAYGYPVGRIGEVEVYFTHYRSFADARAQWHRRAARVRLDRVIVVMQERDGFEASHLRRFEQLAWPRKLLVAASSIDSPGVISVPAWKDQAEVGDTYGEVDLLDPVLTEGVLHRLTTA